jgi:hypothetical protein
VLLAVVLAPELLVAGLVVLLDGLVLLVAEAGGPVVVADAGGPVTVPGSPLALVVVVEVVDPVDEAEGDVAVVVSCGVIPVFGWIPVLGCIPELDAVEVVPVAVLVEFVELDALLAVDSGTHSTCWVLFGVGTAVVFG